MITDEQESGYQTARENAVIQVRLLFTEKSSTWHKS